MFFSLTSKGVTTGHHVSIFPLPCLETDLL